MSEITTVGIDLAKNVFQVHGAGVCVCAVSVPLMLRLH
jgi:hypothetical protein